MKIGKSTQLWSLSSDYSEYERNLNLLSGRLKNSLTPEAINEQILRAGLSNLLVKNRVEVIHDGSDIRKPYSKVLGSSSILVKELCYVKMGNFRTIILCVWVKWGSTLRRIFLELI